MLLFVQLIIKEKTMGVRGGESIQAPMMMMNKKRSPPELSISEKRFLLATWLYNITCIVPSLPHHLGFFD
jgi:hypothetical protein